MFEYIVIGLILAVVLGLGLRSAWRTWRGTDLPGCSGCAGCGQSCGADDDRGHSAAHGTDGAPAPEERT